VDCLETLEEIAMQNRDFFLAAGGQSLRYIPALNDSPEQIDSLAALLQRHLRGWPASADDDGAA
jgi:ferrochelatase